MPTADQTPEQAARFHTKMAALPARLEEMAGWVRLELEQPADQQVSLIRLDTMLSFFLGEARSRSIHRTRRAVETRTRRRC